MRGLGGSSECWGTARAGRAEQGKEQLAQACACVGAFAWSDVDAGPFGSSPGGGGVSLALSPSSL